MHRNLFFLVAGMLVLMFAFGGTVVAQIPQYYNYNNVGTSSNNFPFNVALGKEVQWLALPGEFTQPSPCPAGHNITTLYFFMTGAGSRTFTDFTIRLGQTSITSLPTGAWYTGQMDVVYYRDTVSLASTALSWMSIMLDTPYLYDPSQSLVVEVTQCGATGTGMTVRQNTLTPNRRSYSLANNPCPLPYGGQDGNIVNLGVDVVPAGIPGWTSQTSGITTGLNTVKAVSSQIAWAAGVGGVVLRTTDGGTNWTSVGGGAIGTADIYNVEAINATTAFVTTSPSSSFTHIFRTTDGGTSWDTVFTQTGTNPFINAIHMFNATNGLAEGDPVGGRWTIVRTSDGGATWVRDTVNAPVQVGSEFGANNGMAVLGTTHIWFTPGTGNGIYRSTDGGTTWSRVTLPSSGFTAGVHFIDTQYGVVGNSSGVAARSTDGGATWSPVTIGTSGAIYGVAGAGTLDFWATRGATIHTSNNRGVNWALEYTAPGGTLNHISFRTSGSFADGWAVSSVGGIFKYFNPVNSHDLGVASLTKVSESDQPNSNGAIASDPSTQETATVPENILDGDWPAPPAVSLVPGKSSFTLQDTVSLMAIVENFGTLTEASYSVGWQVNAVSQTPVGSPGPIAPGEKDTLILVWTQAVTGVHTARAWTSLAGDSNPGNDTASLTFSVGRVPGDTLYTFVIPSQIILGVAKIGPSDNLAFTSGGQAAGTTTTDNKWIITDLYGTILDTSFMQINPTAGQGFGFRDLAWDGNWLLTGDDTRLRRIDPATFTELLPPVVTQTNPVRGIAVQDPNRIWIANFTTNPIRVYDTTGAIIRDFGTPTVAPYGLGWDIWTDPDRAWLWYPQPSLTGQNRLSKVDTATGAIVQTFDYSAMVPSTYTVGGFDITNDHPGYPGAVVGFMVIQGFPASRVFAIYLGEDSTVSGVGDRTTGLPGEFVLHQNFPNPFNPSTAIQYGLPAQSVVLLKVYDILGQEVATLVNTEQSAGFFTVHWNGQNQSGSLVASGVYFYRLEARPADGRPPFISRKKMLFLK